MDIVDFDSKHTCCFTKSYRIYRNGIVTKMSTITPLGTGSILQTIPEPLAHPIPRDYNTLKSLHLRYFSANEMKRIHGFPETFTFPEQLTEKQKAKLVGNISFILFWTARSPLLPPCTASPSLSWLTSWRISLILIPNVCSIRCWSAFCLFPHSTKQYSKHSLQSLNNKNKKEQQSIYR